MHITGITDFDATPGTVSFPVGSTVGDIECASFGITDDDIEELEEHFVVSADRNDLFFDAVATVDIVDNDGKLIKVLLEEETTSITYSSLSLQSLQTLVYAHFQCSIPVGNSVLSLWNINNAIALTSSYA